MPNKHSTTTPDSGEKTMIPAEPSHVEQEFVTTLLECITAMEKLMGSHYFNSKLLPESRVTIRDASYALAALATHVADRHCPAPNPVARLRTWTEYPDTTRHKNNWEERKTMTDNNKRTTLHIGYRIEEGTRGFGYLREMGWIVECYSLAEKSVLWGCFQPTFAEACQAACRHREESAQKL